MVKLEMTGHLKIEHRIQIQTMLDNKHKAKEIALYSSPEKYCPFGSIVGFRFLLFQRKNITPPYPNMQENEKLSKKIIKLLWVTHCSMEKSYHGDQKLPLVEAFPPS